MLAEYDISYRLQQNYRNDYKKQVVIDYTDDVSSLIGNVLVEFNEVRRLCIEKEKLMGWGVFSVKAGIDDVTANDSVGIIIS